MIVVSIWKFAGATGVPCPLSTLIERQLHLTAVLWPINVLSRALRTLSRGRTLLGHPHDRGDKRRRIHERPEPPAGFAVRPEPSAEAARQPEPTARKRQRRPARPARRTRQQPPAESAGRQAASGRPARRTEARSLTTIIRRKRSPRFAGGFLLPGTIARNRKLQCQPSPRIRRHS